VGIYLPFFAAYLRGAGFSGEQIGAAQMLPPLVSPVVALAWAAVADRHRSPAWALRRAALVSACAVVFLPAARTPLALAAVLVAQALGERAFVPLLDSVTLEWTHLRARPSYARIRLFGSLGFVALAVAVGRALSLRGDLPGDRLVPLAVVACVIAYALSVQRVPAPPSHGGGRPGLKDLAALARDRRLLLFLGACALHWAACAPYHLFFGVLVRDRGLPSHVTGLGMAAGVVAEVGALLLFPRVERRVSLRALFATAFLGSALRWLLVSRAETAAALVALQLLHGLTFGLFWAAAMDAMAGLVPPRLRATGQALFTAIVFGAGNASGYGLSGVLYDVHRSAAPLFAWAAAVELVALVFAVAFLGGGARAAPAEDAPSVTTRGGVPSSRSR
jgi:PPP family 3-phenylpropionic acid transporter